MNRFVLYSATGYKKIEGLPGLQQFAQVDGVVADTPHKLSDVMRQNADLRECSKVYLRIDELPSR